MHSCTFAYTIVGRINVYNKSLNVIILLTLNFSERCQLNLKGITLKTKYKKKFNPITIPNDNNTGIMFL